MLAALLGDLLLVGDLLGEDDLADFVQRVHLDARFVDHVVHFYHAGQGGDGRPRARVLVQAVAVAAGEVLHYSAVERDLQDVSLLVVSRVAMGFTHLIQRLFEVVEIQVSLHRISVRVHARPVVGTKSR